VNALDVLLALAMLAAGAAGYRLGFVARSLSWAGLGLGVAAATFFVDDLADALGNQPASSRLLAALAFVFAVAITGQALGFAAGVAVRSHLGMDGLLGRGDRIAGAAVGVGGVVVVVWLLAPALGSAPGWTSRAARDSEIVRFVQEVAPPPPEPAQALGRLVGDARFPEVFAPFNGPEEVGPAPESGLPSEVDDRVAASVVQIQGVACDQIQSGSGFVAADGIVVTNAHVVAGEPETTVETPDGRELDATVVAFDGARDLAVLEVDDLELPALVEGEGAQGDAGAVYGFPAGGPLRAAPARIAEVVTARGTDIYREEPTEREVFVLAAALAPGDSGGPLVDAEGLVVGVAFALDPAREDTAYALTNDELGSVLGPVLASGAPSPVDTGACVVG